MGKEKTAIHLYLPQIFMHDLDDLNNNTTEMNSVTSAGEEVTLVRKVHAEKLKKGEIKVRYQRKDQDCTYQWSLCRLN